MLMRFFLLSLFVLNIFLARSQDRPNIVIIISDDHAYQAISAYGDKGFNATPNIDRIADEGMLFNKAYVSNSICGPARAAILTGKFSSENGYKDNETSYYDSSQNQFVNELQKSGYQTAWIGKYHLGRNPQGFDYSEILPGQGHYFNPDFILPDGTVIRKEGYVSDLIEDTAEKWLDQRDTNKPFCLIIGHKATHRTWMPDLDDMSAFDHVTFPLPETFYDNYDTRKAAAVQDMSIKKTMRMDYDLKMYDSEAEADKEGNINRMTPAQRKRFDAYYNAVHDDLKRQNLSGDRLTEWKYQRYMKDYYATALSLDRNIGRTLNYLDTNNLAGNTIVIYISDQGFYLGEHGWFDKRFMYEESFRTPMIIRYPKTQRAATQTDAFVMNVDIAPTLLEAAGVPVPQDMHGRSFLPLLQGKPFRPAENVYYHYYENGEHAVSPHFGIRNNRYKLIRFYKRVESWELFDLKNDPHELHNIYGTKKQRIAKRLKKELLGKIRQYNDNDALLIYNTNID
ncbi:MAG: sulfatase [Capnocytophaga sp.]|nr:sulfatase [Capnocytophaga sp.]